MHVGSRELTQRDAASGYEVDCGPRRPDAAAPEIAGPRGRSRYVADAVAQRVKRDRLRRAIEDSYGSLVPKGGRPMTREEVSAMIEELRSEETD